MSVRGFVEAAFSRRRWVLAGLIALTGLLGYQATKVRPDYSVELLFPVWDPARQTWDRFKAAFPHEDTRAVVIAAAPDILTREGVRRLATLEAELGRVPDVEEVLGPTTVRTLTLAGDQVVLERLLPGPEVDDRRLDHARTLLTTDPLFAWNVATPDASAVSIILRLEPNVAGTDEGRQRLTRQLREVLERHAHPGQQLVLSGVPPIRATFAAMILQDINTLIPLALLGVMVLLWFVFRSVGAVLATLGTILISLVWTYGVLGLLGYPLSMMISILPVLAIIICVSDSVHVVTHFLAARRAGTDPHRSAVDALVETALPCLMTEVVIACGFLSLLAINIQAIFQFGVASAISMLLVWLANVTVLPLALSLTRKVGKAQPSGAVRGFDRFAGWVGRQITTHPGRIVGVAVGVLGAAALAGTGISRTSYIFDDLRPASPEARDIQLAERVHGGIAPISLFIEPTSPAADAALDPELVRLADRGVQMLRSIPEISQANSLADYLRHAATAVGGSDPLDPAADHPATQASLVRALDRVTDPALLQDVLSRDRRALAVPSRVLDCGSECIERIYARVDGWIAQEEAAMAASGTVKARLHATGQSRIFKDVNDILMRGLVGSFSASILISLLASALMLRSWRLGLLALIPNVTPIVLVLGLMAITGIALKPVTVVLFSITLVIAEDDTLQLLARLRKHYALALKTPQLGVDPHVTAALSCMREVALPILTTSVAVSGGFLLLLFSSFLSPAHLGMLIGSTLLAAVLADLFLTPLLVIWFKPFARERAASELELEAAQ